MCGKELVKESCNPLYHTNCKSWRRLCYSVGAFTNWKFEDFHQVTGKLNQIGYHSILQYHAIPSRTWLVAQVFVLIQDKDPKHTSKLCQRYIRNSTSFNWCLGRRNQRTWNPSNWYEMNLTKKSNLNDPQVRFTSDNSYRKAGKNYFQFISSLWWKECRELWDNDNGQRGSFWWIKSLRSFCVF